MDETVVTQEQGTKKGFTIIETMLVLGLTGMLVVGMIAGTFSSIAAQRYNDTVRSFAEYLRTIYSEVISPETLGAGNSKTDAILGKIVVFGSENNSSRIYSATITGSTSTDGSTSGTFMKEFANANPTIYCGDSNHSSTVAGYSPLWEANLMDINGEVKFDSHGTSYKKDLKTSNNFKGTLIIARTPVSSAVHTIWLNNTYDLYDESRCQSESNVFQDDIICSAYKSDEVNKYFPGTNCSRSYNEEVGYNNNFSIGFCIKGDHVSQMREVRITADGRNTSAVTILDTDVGVDEDPDAGGNRCK